MTIKVFSKPGCVQCVATTRYLTEKNVPYEYVDVAEDPAAFDYLVSQGLRGVPVVESPAGTWTGFQPAKLATLH